jgi:hypothetical protein
MWIKSQEAKLENIEIKWFPLPIQSENDLNSPAEKFINFLRHILIAWLDLS